LTEYCSDLSDWAQGRRRRRQDSGAFEGYPRIHESGQFFAGLPNTGYTDKIVPLFLQAEGQLLGRLRMWGEFGRIIETS